jgi:hypothetical protein
VPGWYAFGLPSIVGCRLWRTSLDLQPRKPTVVQSVIACYSRPVHRTATPEREAEKINSASRVDPIARFPRSAVSPLWTLSGLFSRCLSFVPCWGLGFGTSLRSLPNSYPPSCLRMLLPTAQPWIGRSAKGMMQAGG